jgi:hypothetical protein
MQLNEPKHKTSSDLTSTLRARSFARKLFFHCDTTSGTKSMPADLEAQSPPSSYFSHANHHMTS